MPGISVGITGHPWYLEDTAQLPEPLFSPVNDWLPAGETVTGVFVIPPGNYARGFHWQRNPLTALVFTKTGVLHIAAPERGKSALDGVWLSAEHIVKFRLSLVLLYGKLEIWGSQGGGIVKIEAEYNTVAHRFLSPRLKEMIQLTWRGNPPLSKSPAEDPDFPDFFDVSYSFYNGLTFEALQPGEVVQGFVYQPELREPRLKVFYRRLAPQTAMALTNRQLILLQEDLKFQTHHEWIFTFIPRHRIAKLLQQAENGRQRMSFNTLPQNALLPISVLLENDAADKWMRIWQNAFRS